MLTEILLEILKDMDWAASNVIFTDYNTSYRNLRKSLAHNRTWQSRKGIIAENEEMNRQRFYNLLYYLQKQGFVEKKKDKHKRFLWRITNAGIGYIKSKNTRFWAPIKPTTDIKGHLKVISFDVPESQKKKRNWLRQSLFNLGFTMLQKSVWVGNNKLPKDFFLRLRTLGLHPYVHIFAIDKKGTIDFR